ncbi:MAG TPA: type II CAAX endopeptidase family protein [Acidimicrobiales bacterium]|nr:type II CAAX endopeptidase family protein [Acidimicrobiales bacterium]
MGAIIGVAGSLAVYVVYFIVSSTRSLPLNHPGLLLASEIPLWIGFVGATVIASKINGSGSLVRDFNLSWPNWRDLGSGAAGGVLGRLWPLFILFLVAVGTHRGFGPNSASAPRLLGESPTNASGWLILIVLTVVGAPLVEELYFRGLVQGAFSQRIGAIPSIFVTALIFSLVHLTSEGLAAPLALFPMALILGYLRHKTGRLAAGMIAHATFNASILLLFLVPAFR